MKKMFRTGFLLLCSVMVYCNVPAQVKNNVAKVYAYGVKTYAGNVQTDSTGNEITPGTEHVHIVYAETTGKYLPQWNMVFTNLGVYAIQANEIKTGKQEVGKLKDASKSVHIAAKRGNRLWELSLVPVKARIPADIEQLLKTNDVVVTTEFKGQQFTHPVSKEIELASIYYK